MFSYDAELSAATAHTPASIDDVLGTMHAIDGICADGDGLKWFNWLYLGVTNAISARVAAGGFQDPAWMALLDVQFAGLYFSAIHAALSGGKAPACWRAVTDRRNQVAIARIQFALAGMNAHINHDLALALIATCRATGVVPDRGAHYRDYTAVNGTLDILVEEAKRTLHVRLLGDALPPVTHLEDTMAAFGVSASREAAWTNAEMLWALRILPPLYNRALNTLDGMTGFAGKTLLAPVPMVMAVAG